MTGIFSFPRLRGKAGMGEAAREAGLSANALSFPNPIPSPQAAAGGGAA